MVIVALEATPGEVRARVVDPAGQVLGRRQAECPTVRPEAGRRELAPEALWRTTTRLVAELLADDPTLARRIASLEVSGDPAGLVVWDAETLGMPRPAICGDDERAAAGPPLAWVREHDPHCWALVEEGRHLLGGPASYLVARMTRGTWHLTDRTWASTTGLLDPVTGAWSDELAGRVGVPLLALPALARGDNEAVRTDPRSLAGLDVPVRLTSPEDLSPRT